MLTITEFILSEVVLISDENAGRNITIDMFNKTVSAHKNHDTVFPVVSLGTNKNNVLQYNKNSISTCNVEYLIYALKEDENTFYAVYDFIRYRELMPDIKTFNKDNKITKSAFYNAFNDNIPAFIEFFKSCSSETRQQIIYDHICFNHDAKMQGVISLSTYVGNNTFCQARCKNCENAICQYCYAASLTGQRFYLKMKLIRIMAIFTNVELCRDDIPVINSRLYPFFRFESFGDLNNKLQFKNYNLMAAVNPDINFTIWTKNPGIIQACINDGLVLSNNLVIGLSSLYLNTPELDKAKKYSFIRFLFTVYDDQFIKDNNIVINCGAKHCITCGICYKYLHEFKTGLYIINERKK